LRRDGLPVSCATESFEEQADGAQARLCLTGGERTLREKSYVMDCEAVLDHRAAVVRLVTGRA
jgi:hypothetical protein